MIGRNRASQLAGVSACALGAAVVLMSGEAAAACTATFNEEAVTVICLPPEGDEDPSAPFSTSFGGETTYDGAGADLLTVDGGSIVLNGGGPTPVFGQGNLTPAPSVQMLGGTDSVFVSDGTVEATIDLGADDDSAIISGDDTTVADVRGGAGADTIWVGIESIEGEIVYSNPTTGIIFGDDGDDSIAAASGTIEGVEGGAGNDSLYAGTLEATVDIASVGSMAGGDGNDLLHVFYGGAVSGGLDGGAGNDDIRVGRSLAQVTGADEFLGGGTVGGITAGSGDDDIFVWDDADDETPAGGVFGTINAGAGNDDLTISGTGTVGNSETVAAVLFGAGVDTLTLSGGTVNGSIFGQGGNGAGSGNVFTLTGGTVNGTIFAGSENDSVTVSGGVFGVAAGQVDSIGLEGGNDIFAMTGGTLAGGVSGGAGNDALSISGGSAEFANGGAGNDTLTVTGGTLGDVLGEDGNDTIAIGGGAAISAFVNAGAGNDTVSVAGGSVGGVDLAAGADSLTMTGGTITGSVGGGQGVDTVSVRGGTIAGSIDAEKVTLTGGTINGDITGISSDTLIITNATTLNLRNGVLFSGTNAVGTITGTNLAAGGESQNFTGFNSLSLFGSTLRFEGGQQGIGLLSLAGGSTLFANGAPSVTGTVRVNGSTLSLIDGAADDRLTLGGLALNGGTLGIDVDANSISADQIVSQAFSAVGTNTIQVNLIGTPNFATRTDIPILIANNDPVLGNFQILGLNGAGALFSYQIVQLPGGGLVLRATPAGFGIAVATDAAVNSTAANVAIDALERVNRDAMDADLGLTAAALRSDLTPTFAVFASGQLASVQHDGFSITTDGVSGAGPAFDSHDFSAALSLDWNAAKHFEFDNEYGLNFGAFVGYTTTAVGMDSFQGFSAIGNGDNQAGMFGGYTLLRREMNYALVSASGFVGETDITNSVLNTTGNYDTVGYAVTGSVGHIIPLSETARFDLRGGILGVRFTGDSYTDSGGNQYGESVISFGAVKFEPGVYSDIAMEDGKVFSPYLRADIQQRFNYTNTAEIDGQEISFDDADFSVAALAGFNLRVSDKTTVSGEVRGKFSSDSATAAGKLGLKIAF